GTFEHGSSVLQLLTDPDDAERWTRVRATLLEARALRERPARDDKVVAAWNGLAIASLARAAGVLEEPRFLDAALRAGGVLPPPPLVDGRLRRVSRDGVVGQPAGVLEDYGCVAEAFCALAEATADQAWLDEAIDLVGVALDRFAAGDGGFHDTA